LASWWSHERPPEKFLETAAIAIAAWVPFFVWQLGYQTKGVEQPGTIKVSAPPAPQIENPKVITRTLTSEVEKKCWVSNHLGMPNSTIKGTMTATASILRCNHKIEAPWQVTLVFDREFIPGALTLPDSGSWFPGGGPGKQALSYSLQINSPALLSEQLVIVTVYGTTDQFPHALRGSINSLK
jgi:hypothetical protein